MKAKIAKNALWLFLLGLGSGLRIHLIGLISFGELATFVLAPFLHLNHREEFKRAGFTPFFRLIFLVIAGTLISSFYNHTWMFASIKQCAVWYSIYSFSVVLFLLLKDDFKGLGWLALGSFLASIVIIWAFNPTLLVDQSVGSVEMGNQTAEEVVSGVRFWNTRITSLLRLPVVSACFLQLPLAYPLIALPMSAFASFFLSVSGRSDGLISLFAAFLIAFVGKSRKRMMILGRHMMLFLVSLAVLAMVAKSVYKYAATNGWLGYAAREKYHKQTSGGDSMLRLLMGGRSEFFIGMRAALDHPIMGFGCQAQDRQGYWADFLFKYGEIEDYQLYLRLTKRSATRGFMPQIPVHSYLVGFWGNAGIMGLVFCIYIFYLVYVFFKRYACVVPHWYGFFACSIPSLMWGMFFSPYGHGIASPLLFTCLIMVKAVGDGKLAMPREMEVEALRHD